MIPACRRLIILLLILFNSLSGVSQTRSLDYFIDEGLKNSPLLNDLQNQYNSALVDSLIIKAAQRPSVQGRAELLYAPFNDNFGYDEVITDGGTYQATGYVSQRIFNRKLLENNYQSLRNLKQSLGINRKISEAELKMTITSLYLESYSVYSDLTFNRSFFDLMNEQDRLVSDFVKAGIFSQADYLALIVDTREQELIVLRLDNLYLKNLRLLNEFCGLTDTKSVELQAPDIKIVRMDNPADYLILRQYVSDSLKLVNERDALALRYKPAVNWFADAGFLSSTPWNFYRHFGASAGLALTIPIYDGRQRKLEEKKLDFNENTRAQYKLNFKKQYDQKYLRLQGELEGIGRIRAKLKEQLTVSDQLVKSLKSQLESGLVRMTDYLTALKSFRNINHNLNMIDIESMNIINQMNNLLAE